MSGIEWVRYGWADVVKSMLSGGAESSIILWDLERAENTSKDYVHRPGGLIRK